MSGVNFSAYAALSSVKPAEAAGQAAKPKGDANAVSEGFASFKQTMEAAEQTAVKSLPRAPNSRTISVLPGVCPLSARLRMPSNRRSSRPLFAVPIKAVTVSGGSSEAPADQDSVRAKPSESTARTTGVWNCEDNQRVLLRMKSG